MGFKMKGFSPFHQEEKKIHEESFVSGALISTGRRQRNLNDLSFKKAFRLARDAGVKKFTWKGKSYTTETKEEASPAKHKMEAYPKYHGAGGIGWVDEVTAEQVKAHDDKYGEGHKTHSAGTKIAKVAKAMYKKTK